MHKPAAAGAAGAMATGSTAMWQAAGLLRCTPTWLLQDACRDRCAHVHHRDAETKTILRLTLPRQRSARRRGQVAAAVDQVIISVQAIEIAAETGKPE
jgi:hypothetical protein